MALTLTKMEKFTENKAFWDRFLTSTNPDVLRDSREPDGERVQTLFNLTRKLGRLELGVEMVTSLPNSRNTNNKFVATPFMIPAPSNLDEVYLFTATDGIGKAPLQLVDADELRSLPIKAVGDAPSSIADGSMLIILGSGDRDQPEPVLTLARTNTNTLLLEHSLFNISISILKFITVAV